MISDELFGDANNDSFYGIKYIVKHIFQFFKAINACTLISVSKLKTYVSGNFTVE